MKEKQIKCKICNKEVNGLKGLGLHIRYTHVKKQEIESVQFYYDKYLIKDEMEKLCEHCGKEVEFLSLKNGYKRHCNHECSQKNIKSRKLKRQRTEEVMLKKYGVKNAMDIPGSKNKIKKTKLERYGDENYVNVKKCKETHKKNHGCHFTQTEEYLRKTKETSQKKYNTDYPSQSKEVRDKMKETCLEKYGTEYALQAKEVRDEIDKTMKEKYGGIGMASKEINEKIQETIKEKYGEKGIRCDEINEKRDKTNIERYGSKHTLQNKQILQSKYGVDDINQLDWVVEKQKDSRKKTLNEKYDIDNVSQLEWVQDTIKENNLKKYGFTNPMQNEEIKERFRQTMYDKYGEYNPMHVEEIFLKQQKSLQKKSYQLKEYKTIYNNTIHYQSKSELNFIKHCEVNNIHIEDGDTINYIHNNKKHKYYVDFKIKEKDKWRLIEIKKKHMWWYQGLNNGSINAKIKGAVEYSRKHNYLPYKIKFNF